MPQARPKLLFILYSIFHFSVSMSAGCNAIAVSVFWLASRDVFPWEPLLYLPPGCGRPTDWPVCREWHTLRLVMNIPGLDRVFMCRRHVGVLMALTAAAVIVCDKWRPLVCCGRGCRQSENWLCFKFRPEQVEMKATMRLATGWRPAVPALGAAALYTAITHRLTLMAQHVSVDFLGHDQVARLKSGSDFVTAQAPACCGLSLAGRDKQRLCRRESLIEMHCTLCLWKNALNTCVVSGFHFCEKHGFCFFLSRDTFRILKGRNMAELTFKYWLEVVLFLGAKRLFELCRLDRLVETDFWCCFAWIAQRVAP